MRWADAVHAVGGLFVLDGVASGALWVDMAELGVDVLVSAPQKVWSASPCCGLVMLGEAALARLDATTSTSFACDLKKWLQIMQTYESGGHAYHATMPTDGLTGLRDVMGETEQYGLERARAGQLELGRRVRALLSERGFASVAAPGFEAPGVVVSYTMDAEIQSGKKFAAQGCRPPPACRCNATSRRTSAPSASACSAGQAAERGAHGGHAGAGAGRDGLMRCTAFHIAPAAELASV